MKIYILDEVFDFAKKIGIITRINDLAKKKYNPSTIQSDLQSYYDIMNSKEYLDLMTELETKLKADDMYLYNLFTYTKIQSFDVVAELLNSVKNLRDRFVLLEKNISYKLSSAYEYEILISLFCAMYEEVAEDVRAGLPKYIHLAYYNFVSIKFCTTQLSTAGNLDMFDEYEKFMQTKFDNINKYINDKDTLRNLRLELRCAALQYLIPRMDRDVKYKTLAKIEKLIDPATLDFDNKENSIGVIWTMERLYELYFDLSDYKNFFKWVYKQYQYIDNALFDKEKFFDGLRYYNKNNITGFIISMRRFYYIQNLYPIFNMEFRNVIQSDEDFITNPNLEYTLYDTYANKLLLDKFKNYVDTWFANSKAKLDDLAKNESMLKRCKRIIVDGVDEATAIKETEDKNKASATADYDSTEHPENTNTATPGTFTEENHTSTGDTSGSPVVPKLPDGFNLDHRELNRLSETTESESPASNTEASPDLNPVPKDHPIATDDLSEEELAALNKSEDE